MINIIEYLYCLCYVSCLTAVLVRCLREKIAIKRLVIFIFIYSVINYAITGSYAKSHMEFYINNLLVLVCDFIYCCKLFKIRQWNCLFYTNLYFCLYCLNINIMIQLLNIIVKYQMVNLMAPSMQRAMVVLCVNIATLLEVKVIRVFNIMPEEKILNQGLVLFNGLNCLVLLMFSVGYKLSTIGIVRHMLIIVLGLFIIWIGGMKLITDNILNRNRNEELALQALSSNYIVKYIDFYTHESEKIKKLKHDLKNHRLVLENINNIDYDKYVDNIFEEIEINDYINTGNIFIDSCLYAKQQEFPDIDFKYDISIAGLTMKSNDITTLLFNLIDNASTAALKSDHKVYVKIRYVNNILKISIKNRYVGDLNFKSAKGPGHGYGIPIINSIVEKYGGNIFIDNQEDFVIFNISIEV